VRNEGRDETGVYRVNISPATEKWACDVTHPQVLGQAPHPAVEPSDISTIFYIKNAIQLFVITMFLLIFSSFSFLTPISIAEPLNRTAKLARLQSNPARHCQRPLMALSGLKISGERGYTLGLGRSMLPTMKVGALALIWRVPPAFRLKRGMIIYFQRPSGENWLKRVIGLPGDRIVYRQAGANRTFRINGTAIMRSEGAKRVRLTWVRRDGRGRRLTTPSGAPLLRSEVYRQYTETLSNGVSYKILHRAVGDPPPIDRQLTVPAGYLFVMGDNRQHSFDSRFSRFGVVARRAVRGLALCDITRKELMGK
jgi:signal peptidase I